MVMSDDLVPSSAMRLNIMKYFPHHWPFVREYRWGNPIFGNGYEHVCNDLEKCWRIGSWRCCFSLSVMISTIALGTTFIRLPCGLYACLRAEYENEENKCIHIFWLNGYMTRQTVVYIRWVCRLPTSGDINGCFGIITNNDIIETYCCYLDARVHYIQSNQTPSLLPWPPVLSS